jgi:hypothetical protein
LSPLRQSRQLLSVLSAENDIVEEERLNESLRNRLDEPPPLLLAQPLEPANPEIILVRLVPVCNMAELHRHDDAAGNDEGAAETRPETEELSHESVT